MRNLLAIKSSIRGNQGFSNTLVDHLIMRWGEHNPQDTIQVRDLQETPVPHLSEATFLAMPVPLDQRTPEQHAVMALSDELCNEFMHADVVVLGVPMYNLSIPSMLKAYIDHVMRVGITFRYTQEGPVGLAGDKAVYIACARGGIYWGTSRDTQTAYLNALLGLMGIQNIRYIVAEGLNIDAQLQAKAMGRAKEEIDALFD